MKTLFTLGCLTALTLAALPAAQATTVSYSFTVSGNAGNGIGSFQFDDSTATSSPFGETEYRLTGFSFNFGGQDFELSSLDLNTRLALFDGSQFLGLEAQASAGQFSFLPAVGTQNPFLVTARASSTVSYRLDNGAVVPEPGTIGLGLAALAVVGALRRRRSV